MLDAYLPILAFVVLAVIVATVIVVGSRVFGQQKPSAVKLAPYECGMPLHGTAREQISVKFYIIAMLFIVFDIEVAFLYPWAVMFKKLGLFGFYEMGTFVLVLLVGYIYAWKKGALEWE
ncbi:MAG: NADH-quinone oxidoreductase subunit A [Desulfuromonadales bacterium]|nr:NADH-quinone oxidoreductase subunit A [Desulfuromonadales bacterium]